MSNKKINCPCGIAPLHYTSNLVELSVSRHHKDILHWWKDSLSNGRPCAPPPLTSSPPSSTTYQNRRAWLCSCPGAKSQHSIQIGELYEHCSVYSWFLAGSGEALVPGAAAAATASRAASLNSVRASARASTPSVTVLGSSTDGTLDTDSTSAQATPSSSELHSRPEDAKSLPSGGLMTGDPTPPKISAGFAAPLPVGNLSAGSFSRNYPVPAVEHPEKYTLTPADFKELLEAMGAADEAASAIAKTMTSGSSSDPSHAAATPLSVERDHTSKRLKLVHHEDPFKRHREATTLYTNHGSGKRFIVPGVGGIYANADSEELSFEEDLHNFAMTGINAYSGKVARVSLERKLELKDVDTSIEEVLELMAKTNV